MLRGSPYCKTLSCLNTKFVHAQSWKKTPRTQVKQMRRYNHWWWTQVQLAPWHTPLVGLALSSELVDVRSHIHSVMASITHETTLLFQLIAQCKRLAFSSRLTLRALAHACVANRRMWIIGHFSLQQELREFAAFQNPYTSTIIHWRFTKSDEGGGSKRLGIRRDFPTWRVSYQRSAK
jgi:hypothetical protein